MMLKLILSIIILCLTFWAGVWFQSGREIAIIAEKESHQEFVKLNAEVRDAVKEKNRYIVAYVKEGKTWKKKSRSKRPLPI